MSFRILVAEDIGNGSQGSLAGELKKMGHEVFASGPSRDSVVRTASENAFDVAVVDWEGLGAAAKTICRTLSTRWPVPIVALMNGVSEDELQEATAAGVQAALPCPVGEASLQLTIPMVCWQHQAMRSLEQKLKDAQWRLEERKVVERAKGILVDKHGLSEEKAYERLRRCARRHRKPLGEAARGVIDADRFLAEMDAPSDLA